MEASLGNGEIVVKDGMHQTIDHAQVVRSTAGCSVFSATFASMLYELGTEEQKEKYMVPSVKGEFHGAHSSNPPIFPVHRE